MPQPRTFLYIGFLAGPHDDPRQDSSWLQRETMLDMDDVQKAMKVARGQVEKMKRKAGEKGKIDASRPNCIIFKSSLTGVVHCWFCTDREF